MQLTRIWLFSFLACDVNRDVPEPAPVFVPEARDTRSDTALLLYGPVAFAQLSVWAFGIPGQFPFSVLIHAKPMFVVDNDAVRHRPVRRLTHGAAGTRVGRQLIPKPLRTNQAFVLRAPDLPAEAGLYVPGSRGLFLR